MIAVALAGLVVLAGQIFGWHGVDLAAQVYRVDSFKTTGFAIWDFQWYGGHFTLDYSVIYPALASVLGVAPLAVISAMAATLGFERMVTEHFGRAGRAAAVVFAFGTLVQSSIGQMTFLTGEAFALLAGWAVIRQRWKTAAALALMASLSSPLAGAFIAMAAAAWVLGRWKDPGRAGRLAAAAALAAAAGAPIVVTFALFPGEGPMPYPVIDYVFEICVAIAFWIVAGLRAQNVVRWGAVVFMATATVAVAVPSSLGGNVGRMEDVFALPLAIALLWTGWRAAIPFLTWPLLLSQWGPAWGAITASPDLPSTHEAFYTPLDDTLQRLAVGEPKGRVEVVPTEYHWEAAYVAPVMPLARGWERQLDVADNPIFYDTDDLTTDSYRAWLLDNGVRFVALPAAPLDPAGQAEGRLVASGKVPGLRLVWSSSDWRLYSVDGSHGIVSSPAVLVSTGDDSIVVDAPRAGPVVVRVRTSRYWTISEGAGCILSPGGPEAPTAAAAGDQWVTVEVPTPEQFSLSLSLLDGGDQCPSSQTAVADGSSSGRSG